MNLMRFLRKNMNKMLWVLIILIAAAFGITGTMTDVFQYWWGYSAIGTVFGRAVYPGEFTNTRKKLEREGSGQEISEQDVWERIAQLEEAKRCSITVSDGEVSDNIIRAYRILKLRDDIIANSKDREERDRRFQEISRLPEHLFRQRLEEIQFDTNEYARLIVNYLGISVDEYEELVRERLILSRLESFVRGSAKISTKRLYEDFIETDHMRKIECAAINSVSFKDKVDTPDSRLQEFYEANKERYMEPDRIAFEYVMARTEQFKNDIPTPNDEEQKEYYEKWRHTYFRRPEREIQQPAKPDDIYKPFEEVKVEVISHFLDDKAKELARKTLKDLKTELDAEQELPFEKVQEIAKKFNLEVKETEPFQQGEFPYKFENEFGRCREADMMFLRKDEITALSKGKYNDPAECDFGLFIYRLSKLIAQHIPQFEKLKEEVKEDFISEESAKLARREAQEMAKEIEEQKDITRDILLKYNSYSIVTDFFANINRQGRIPAIADDYRIITSSFDLKDVGDISDPVDVWSMGNQIFYVIRYLERKDPAFKDFKEKRASILYQSRSSETRRLSEEWISNLEERARITPVKERPRQVPESGEED